jgi:hypothetical protein
MKDEGEIYIRVQHPAYGSIPERPDELIGPFPVVDIAVKHRLLYGPMAGEVVRLHEEPAAEWTMTPGEAVDYMLGRY